jgi:predicted site-specific integrase-resolvase
MSRDTSVTEALEPSYPEVVGTAKAALWLGMSEETVRRLCRAGRIKADQPSGYQGKWLISTSELERKRSKPKTPTK